MYEFLCILYLCPYTGDLFSDLVSVSYHAGMVCVSTHRRPALGPCRCVVCTVCVSIHRRPALGPCRCVVCTVRVSIHRRPALVGVSYVLFVFPYTGDLLL